MAAKAALWAPILSLLGPNSRNIRAIYLPIQRLSRVQHRSNEVVLEGAFSELRLSGFSEVRGTKTVGHAVNSSPIHRHPLGGGDYTRDTRSLRASANRLATFHTWQLSE